MTPDGMAKIAAMHERLIKEAFLQMLGRGAVSAAKSLLKSPGKALGGALTGMGVVSDIDRSQKLVNKFPTQVMPIDPVTM